MMRTQLPATPNMVARLTPNHSAHIEPLWHAWISYAVDTPPSQDPIKAASEKPWSPKEHVPNRTFTRGAFKTYNTFVSPFSFLLPSPFFLFQI